MYFFSPPPLAQIIAPGPVVWRVNTTQKKIYLTFDDGPTPGVTDELLTILAGYGAKATFFCLGRQVEKHKGLFEKIITQQHSIGSHSFTHLNAWKTLPGTWKSDVYKAAAIIPSPLFRPPYGRLPFVQKNKIIKDFVNVMWTLMSYDYDSSISPHLILDVFSRRTTRGDIWVFHDTHQAAPICLHTVPRLLEWFSQRGYEFEGLHKGLNIN